MSIIEIRCPNCGSPNVTKNGKDYTCAHCQRMCQIVIQPQREIKPKQVNTEIPKIQYGKITFKADEEKTIGNFTLQPYIKINYTTLQLFKFHAFRRVIRGSKTVDANEFGYVFINPFSGIVNSYASKDKQLPEPDDMKEGLYKECIKIISDNAFEEKPYNKY